MSDVESLRALLAEHDDIWFDGNQPPGDRDFGCLCDTQTPLGHIPQDDYEATHREHLIGALVTAQQPLLDRLEAAKEEAALQQERAEVWKASADEEAALRVAAEAERDEHQWNAMEMSRQAGIAEDRAESAEAERDELSGWIEEHALVKSLARAEAAEAKVARGLALADEWERYGGAEPFAWEALRAALDGDS